MSGVLRNIQAEIQRKGQSSEAALKAAMSPAAQLSEKGRTIFTGVAAKKADAGSYLGKNQKPAK